MLQVESGESVFARLESEKPKRTFGKRLGFTLIELLVVIAIIGILAAIAMTNFRAASVRAKVSRAMAEIRTVVGALEVYRLDRNAYPTYHYDGQMNFFIGGSVTDFNSSPPFDGANPLTTPVRYITTFPDDPFATATKVVPEGHQYLYTNWPYAIEKVPAWDVFIDLYKVYGDYRIHSRGPDLQGPDSGIPYDPTNGTTSRGDVTYGPKTGFGTYHYFPFVQ